MGTDCNYTQGEVSLKYHQKHRTDNMIKNQFYSTLRRQQRKINRLLVSKAFESLIGAKIKEISTDELYKYIKDEKIDYDDIKGIYEKAVKSVREKDTSVYKAEAISEVRSEMKDESKNSLMNRRSYRLSRKKKSADEDDYDVTKVAFLVLFKILRAFREMHKNDIHGLSSFNSLGSPVMSHRSSRSRNTTARKNKRKVKEELKKEELVKCSEDIDKVKKFETKYSNPQDKGLVPTNYKSLFWNMEKSEDEDYIPPKGIRSELFLSNGKTKSLQNAKNKTWEVIPEFSLKDDLTNREKRSISISSEEEKPIKSKISIEEDGPKHDSNRYLSVNTSPNKKINFETDRDHSMNSNLSQSFGYNNEDFVPFGNKNKMNLSKPQEFNYDVGMTPSISFMGNMISKMSGVSKTVNKQLSLTLNFFNQDQSMNDFESSIYDLNQLSGCLNVSLSKNKCIMLEMIDDTHIQVRKMPKEVSNFHPPSISFNRASTPSMAFKTGNYPSFPNEMMQSNKFSKIVDGVRSNTGAADINRGTFANSDKNTIVHQNEMLVTGSTPNFNS